MNMVMTNLSNKGPAVKAAVVAKDIKVAFATKRDLFYPLMKGLAEVILRDGSANIVGFGKFKVRAKNVCTGPMKKGEKREGEIKTIYTISFKPSRTLIKEATKRWGQECSLVSAISSPESASSAPEEVREASSAEEGAAKDDSSTTNDTDW